MRVPIICLLSASFGVCQSPLHFSGGLDSSISEYSSHHTTRKFRSNGAWLDMDWKYGGFRIGANEGLSDTREGYRSKQVTQLGAIRFYFPLSDNYSKFILEIDGMRSKGFSDYHYYDGKTKVSGLHLGYLGGIRGGTMGLMVDLGAAKTHFDHWWEPLDVTQWQSSVGVGFNGSVDWIIATVEHIRLKNQLYPVKNKNAFAYAVSWSHYYAPGNVFKPNSTTLSLQSGNRFYAVNTKTGTLFNHADSRHFKADLDANWKINDKLSFGLGFGKSFYKNVYDFSAPRHSSWTASTNLSFHL